MRNAPGSVAEGSPDAAKSAWDDFAAALGAVKAAEDVARFAAWDAVKSEVAAGVVSQVSRDIRLLALSLVDTTIMETDR